MPTIRLIINEEVQWFTTRFKLNTAVSCCDCGAVGHQNTNRVKKGRQFTNWDSLAPSGVPYSRYSLNHSEHTIPCSCYVVIDHLHPVLPSHSYVCCSFDVYTNCSHCSIVNGNNIVMVSSCCVLWVIDRPCFLLICLLWRY